MKNSPAKMRNTHIFSIIFHNIFCAKYWENIWLLNGIIYNRYHFQFSEYSHDEHMDFTVFSPFWAKCKWIPTKTRIWEIPSGKSVRRSHLLSIDRTSNEVQDVLSPFGEAEHTQRGKRNVQFNEHNERPFFALLKIHFNLLYFCIYCIKFS